MLQPNFTVSVEAENNGYVRFSIEPMEKGYGHTLGVSLRRVLLTSIEGSAISSVKLDRVNHQYTTLSGMKEDVVDFILNLKQLNLSLESGTDSAVVKLDAKGPGPVKGKDLILPPEVTLANPDLTLAMLSDSKAKLSAEITVTRGFGYSPASDRPTNTLGEIPVDAAYSPVQKVAYRVESTRVGRRTDFDKLVLEVWTNGTVNARDVLNKAAEILVAHFKQIFDPVVVDSPKEPTLETRLEDEVYKLTVEELDLPTRIANALRKGGYKSVKDLVGATNSDIAKVKNLGEKSVDVVADALAQKNLTLKADLNPETIWDIEYLVEN